MTFCVWCRTRIWFRTHYHAVDCPMLTGLYPAQGAECFECEEPMDFAVPFEDDGVTVFCCVGCAATEVLCLDAD